MKSLRILWGFALAVAAGALLLVSWLVPVPADAAMPQAPGSQASLTVAVDVTGNTVTISGTLTGGGQPIAGASIAVLIDVRSIGSVTTGQDGSYSTQTTMTDNGSHMATAVFNGDSTYRMATGTQRFTMNPPATTAPVVPTTITAQLAPNPVAAGAVLAVTGNVSSGGVPVDSSRVDISCDFGGVSALGVTDASGNFSANLSLPTTGKPSKVTVTVSFAGDNRFLAAKGTFQAAVTAAASATPSATPSIAPETTPPPTDGASAVPSVASSVGTMALQNASTPITTFGIVLAIVGVGSVAALGVLWVLAWRRHYLLPGERRGFGSDFGRRRPSV